MEGSVTGTESLTEQNRAVIEALYAAAKAGDAQAMFAHFADDIVVHEPPFLPFGKVYRGKEEFLQLFAVIVEYLDVSQVTVHHIVADGEYVIGCLGMPDRRTGDFTEMLEQFKLRDGKVVDIKLFYYDAGTMTDLPKAV